VSPARRFDPHLVWLVLATLAAALAAAALLGLFEDVLKAPARPEASSRASQEGPALAPGRRFVVDLAPGTHLVRGWASEGDGPIVRQRLPAGCVLLVPDPDGSYRRAWAGSGEALVFGRGRPRM